MNISAILMNQIMIMFLLMSVGYICYKKSMITDQGSKDFSKLLLYIVLPSVIIKNFMIERSNENIEILIFSAIVTAICLLIAMVISYMIFGKKDGIANFSSSFSNAGFIGIPLVQATLGDSAVFYISMMIVLVNILQWTYGVFVITQDKSNIRLKKIVTNPAVISMIIGLVIFLVQVPVPNMAVKILDIFSAMNTPLAMLVCGVYLAQTDLLAMFKNRRSYEVSFVRLILIPLVTIFVLKFLPCGSVDLKIAILISASCPVGSNVAIFANQFKKDHKSAIEQVCMTTLFCLILLPLMISLATAVL